MVYKDVDLEAEARVLLKMRQLLDKDVLSPSIWGAEVGSNPGQTPLLQAVQLIVEHLSDPEKFRNRDKEYLKILNSALSIVRLSLPGINVSSPDKSVPGEGLFPPDTNFEIKEAEVAQGLDSLGSYVCIEDSGTDRPEKLLYLEKLWNEMQRLEGSKVKTSPERSEERSEKINSNHSNGSYLVPTVLLAGVAIIGARGCQQPKHLPPFTAPVAGTPRRNTVAPRTVAPRIVAQHTSTVGDMNAEAWASLHDSTTLTTTEYNMYLGIMTAYQHAKNYDNSENPDKATSNTYWKTFRESLQKLNTFNKPAQTAVITKLLYNAVQNRLRPRLAAEVMAFCPHAQKLKFTYHFADGTDNPEATVPFNAIVEHGWKLAPEEGYEVHRGKAAEDYFAKPYGVEGVKQFEAALKIAMDAAKKRGR